MNRASRKTKVIASSRPTRGLAITSFQGIRSGWNLEEPRIEAQTYQSCTSSHRGHTQRRADSSLEPAQKVLLGVELRQPVTRLRSLHEAGEIDSDGAPDSAEEEREQRMERDERSNHVEEP